MLRFLAMTLLLGCAHSHQFIRKVLPTESPCFDGVVLNIGQRGCDSFFWRIDDGVVKIRCTSSINRSWWTDSSFYVVPLEIDQSVHPDLSLICTDIQVKIFVVSPDRE